MLSRFLVGPAEIGELLKVEANTINVWKVRHPDFPPPVRRLRSGDVWDSREITAWAVRTGRIREATPADPSQKSDLPTP